MVYEGKERRKLLNLRNAIDWANRGSELAMTRMARMLGPDRLGELNEELGRCHRGEYRSRMSKPQTGREIALASNMMRIPVDKMPDHYKVVLGYGLESYCFSEKTMESLNDAGIITVGDFARKTRKQLKKQGVSNSAIKEVSGVLLNWGIRTVDNPPEPGTPGFKLQRGPSPLSGN